MDSSVETVSGRPEIVVAGSEADLHRRAAERFVSVAEEAAAARGMFSVALAGGNTPRSLYALLATDEFASRVPWDRTQVYFSDERFVPADSPESNQRMATEALLSRVPIPERFVHRVATTDASPDEAAALYEEGIRRTLSAAPGEVPRFDLVMLGLGPDGHTASLFPGSEALNAVDYLVAANFVEEKDSWRITFTYPLINAARCIMFLVEGESKSAIVSRVLAGEDLPAARVRSEQGRVVWLLDDGAARKLPAELRTG
jgi:6-phosphogluconolactonase